LTARGRREGARREIREVFRGVEGIFVQAAAAKSSTWYSGGRAVTAGASGERKVGQIGESVFTREKRSVRGQPDLSERGLKMAKVYRVQTGRDDEAERARRLNEEFWRWGFRNRLRNDDLMRSIG
jgi:hypothetical protein